MLRLSYKAFIAKGFWLVEITLVNPAFYEYVKYFEPWLESVGSSVFKIIRLQAMKVMVEN